MRIAVLAVQGAFIEHEQMLHQLGVETVQLRKKEDLNCQYQGIILPGGESTVQGKLLKEFGMFEELQSQIRAGIPVMGTCAGLILLANKIVNQTERYLGTLPITVLRNGYGRQLGSFYSQGNVGKIDDFPMKFIRAPYIDAIEDSEAVEEVKILAKVDGRIVAVQYKNQIGVSFHPELTKDTRIHQSFLQLTNTSTSSYNIGTE